MTSRSRRPEIMRSTTSGLGFNASKRVSFASGCKLQRKLLNKLPESQIPLLPFSKGGSKQKVKPKRTSCPEASYQFWFSFGSQLQRRRSSIENGGLEVESHAPFLHHLEEIPVLFESGGKLRRRFTPILDQKSMDTHKHHMTRKNLPASC